MKSNLMGSLLLMLTFVPNPAFADDPRPAGLKGESEAGLVIVSGNSDSQSVNLGQSLWYYWPSDLLKFRAAYLKTESSGVESAKSWALGLRYERSLVDDISAFAGELAEGDLFAGFVQRYSTDLGARYQPVHDGGWTAATEAGYRYTSENRLAGNVTYSLLRFYAEVTRAFNADVSGKLWAELLPNLTNSSDYQANTEISTIAAISSVFSIKAAYLVKFRNQPPVGVAKTTDRNFTASLVAKF